MRIDKYLDLYLQYRNTYIQMKRMRECFKGDNERMFVYDSSSNYVHDMSHVDRELVHRERILRYATARLQAAMARMNEPSEVNYLICRYFYDMKNIAIASAFSYCERQIYRIARSSKEHLYLELLRLMPKARRGEVGKKYRFASKRYPICV